MLVDLNRMREMMAENALDGVVVFSRPNILYMSDFQCFADRLPHRPFCVALFAKPSHEAALIVPAVDLPQAKAVSWIRDVRAYTEFGASRGLGYGPSCEAVLKTILEDRGLLECHVGYEDRFIPGIQFEKLRAGLPRLQWKPASLLIERVRRIKTLEELSRLRRAAEITVAGFRKLAACIREGVSEAELVREVKTEMFREGADNLLFVGLSLDSQSPYPHIEEPSEHRRVRSGDLVTMDMGCIYRGYNADFARSYVCKHARGEEIHVYHELCQRQLRLIERIRPGAIAADIYDQVAEEGRRAMGEFHFELCGHGLGLELHEGPVLRHNNPEPVLPGMVICVELARWLANPTRLLHIEDTVIVSETGTECLTASLPRELLAVTA